MWAGSEMLNWPCLQWHAAVESPAFLELNRLRGGRSVPGGAGGRVALRCASADVGPAVERVSRRLVVVVRRGQRRPRSGLPMMTGRTWNQKNTWVPAHGPADDDGSHTAGIKCCYLSRDSISSAFSFFLNGTHTMEGEAGRDVKREIRTCGRLITGKLDLH